MFGWPLDVGWMICRRIAVLGGLAALSCTGSIDGPDAQPEASDGDDDPRIIVHPPPLTPVLPFEPLEAAVGAAKVKKVMTGVPLSEEERALIASDQSQLPDLIERWMELPEWRQRLLFFFQQAFQQTQTDIDSYIDQIYHGVHIVWKDNAKMIANAEESFARTALGLVEEGRPFTEVLTTRRHMMTTGLLHTIAFIDTMPRDDLGKDAGNSSWFLEKYPGYTYRGRTGGTALFAESSWMHGGNLFGGGGGASENLFTDSDWSDWRWVTFRQPQSIDETTDFNDLPALRSASEAVLYGPRVGFFTTPAFFANWCTNIDNASRVLANQTLIAGLDRSIDGENITVLLDDSNVEKMHADPKSGCYGCHVMLDPMRDFFRMDYGYYGHPRSNPPPTQKPFPTSAQFTLDGSEPVVGTNLYDLGDAMAEHPSFATAWTQKLCRFANSEICAAEDPEFQRVAAAFRDSGFQFPVLVRELMSSPIVTYASRTQSAEKFGVVVGIARQAILCQALEARTGIRDVCNLNGRSALSTSRLQRLAANLSLAVPGDAYARGEEKPLMPRDPNLFLLSAIENLCTVLSAELVEGPASRYTAAEKDEAIKDFATTLMDVPTGDARFGEVVQVLEDHYAAALEAGVSATDALRDTFVLACESPLTVSIAL